MSHFSLPLALLFLASCASGRIDTPAAFSATDENDVSALAAFLKAGGDPNSVNTRGESLLYVATGPHGGVEVLELLLEHGADPDVGGSGYTPLMNASSWCAPDAVRLLINAGADVKLKNEAGETALDTVCARGKGREEVIALLRAADV